MQRNKNIKNFSIHTVRIYDAMSKVIEGEKHTPEKISFQYLRYDLNNMDKLTERRKGAIYTVSPYKLIINDGNYYLLAFDDYAQDMRTYRVDRMKNIKIPFWILRLKD